MLKYRAWGLFWLLLLFLLAPQSGVTAPLDGASSKKQSPQPAGAIFLSIAPTQAEPEALVSITYGGEMRGARILLGGDELSFQQLEERKLTFTVPAGKMPGQYALTVRSVEGISRSYAFTVLPLKPLVTKIEPDRITACRHNGVQHVVVYGKNFTDTSQVVFDGAALSSKYISSESLSFALPKVAGGLHQVAVKNAHEIATPVGLQMITAPAISSVAIGDDRVSSYDLVLEGENFQQNSIVIANGNQISSSSDMQAGGQLTYIDCNRIVYQRRPYSSTRQELRIQVVNPGGEISQIYVVSAP